MKTKIAICQHDGRWTVELDLSSAEEQMLFGLTLVEGQDFDSMHDAATAIAGAIDLDLRLACSPVRH